MSWLPALPPQDLAPEEVHVWAVVLDHGEPARAACLSADEAERAAEMRHEGRRAQFIAARSALRAILGAYCGEVPASLRFRYARGGKPELDSATELRFNLSHSGALALCGVALNREVGVDIEQVRDRRDLDAIAERFFTAAERSAIAALVGQERLAEFFRCWTRREAGLKLLGGSVFGAPEPTPGRDAHTLAPRPGYVAAVAASGGDWRLRAWTYSAR